MLLLISDANIIIDMEIGGLLAPMFSLEYEYGVPDILFYEELEDQHANLTALGLQVMSIDESLVRRVSALAQTHIEPSRNDLFALVLAEHEACPLLSGDADLRAAATVEGIEVRGTLWLVEEMVRQQKITVHVARSAYALMRVNGRRLPWQIAEERLTAIESDNAE